MKFSVQLLVTDFSSTGEKPRRELTVTSERHNDTKK